MSIEDIIDKLKSPQYRATGESANAQRVWGARRVLTWLLTFPGETWQERWKAAPVEESPESWTEDVIAWSEREALRTTRGQCLIGVLALLCVEAVRPSLNWLLTETSGFFSDAIARRDAEGFRRLEEAVGKPAWQSRAGGRARKLVATIVAAKGGRVADITVGDCLELREALARTQARKDHSLFYAWLRESGVFPSDAPPTLRYIARKSGQRTIQQLVDRYDLKNRGVRDLLVSYLAERQPALDYSSLDDLARILGSYFWADLEKHHPGIKSLKLAPDVASAWKQRIQFKEVRRLGPDGVMRQTAEPRVSAIDILIKVNSFYHDIAQWAADDPVRWVQWVAPSPVAPADVSSYKKHESRRKARTDQRTRERLPHVDVILQIAERRRDEARQRLDAALAAEPGVPFEVLGERLVKAPGARWSDPMRSTTVYDESGKRRDLAAAEVRAFWAWAISNFLRHTGARLEEMLEVSQQSLVHYKLPSTGEMVPLVQIAPSKTDKERLILVSPELLDIISVIVDRIRAVDGTIPLVSSYDRGEKVYNSPMPLLFQWAKGGERSSISFNSVRRSLVELLESTGIVDDAGNPLHFQPHDFRRIFVTDALMSGLPPHIAQVICGHDNINTTIGYNTVYPTAVIDAHRAFIERRRKLRPSEEYRVITEEEWDEFLGHFEKRKLSLGNCGRSLGSPCIHEHACLRCPMLQPDPSQRARAVEIQENLKARIAEAEREGWYGELEGLMASLRGAEAKLLQLDACTERRARIDSLNMPTFDQVAVPRV